MRSAPGAGAPAVVVCSPTADRGPSLQQPAGVDDAGIEDECEVEAVQTRAAKSPCDPFDARFVSWNVARATSEKVAQIERLIRDFHLPPFVALQETGSVETTDSALAGMAQKLGYNVLSKRRSRDEHDREHHYGGVVLLVNNELTAEPYTWPEADEWAAECETVSVKVFRPGGQSFIVSSVYVGGTSKDVEGFDRLLRSARDNQVILGDLNAQLPEQQPGVFISPAHQLRGEKLNAFIIERGWFVPRATAVTRPATRAAEDGRKVRLAVGSTYDHILVGRDVVACAVHSEATAYVCDECEWPSDHIPITWGAELGLHASNASAQTWRRAVAWHRVEARHKVLFNNRIQRLVRRARLENHRALQMQVIERALTTAARDTLPHTHAPPQAPPPGDESGDDGDDVGEGGGVAPPVAAPAAPAARAPFLYDTPGSRAYLQRAAARHGNGNIGKIAQAASLARRKLLTEHAVVEPNPSSAFRFMRQWYGMETLVVVSGLIDCGAAVVVQFLSPPRVPDAVLIAEEGRMLEVVEARSA